MSRTKASKPGGGKKAAASSASSPAAKARPTRAAKKGTPAASTAAAPTSDDKARGKKRAREAQEKSEPVQPAVKGKGAASAPKKAKKQQPAPAEESDSDDDEPEQPAQQVEGEHKDQQAQEESDSADVEGLLDEDEIIKGFSDVSGSDDEADSSDEDEDDEDDVAASKNAPIATVKLPNAKDDHSVKQRLDKVAKRKQANKATEVPGTLYVGRLPVGFYEAQLREYFTQFGDVRRLRVSRNRKTGKPKHYAFVEFADEDVATIVQETMNNYLIDGHLLQVRHVPKEKVHPKLWIGANRKFRPVPTDRLERVKRSQPRSEAQEAKRNEKLVKRQQSKRDKLKAAGIDYGFEGYKVEA